LYVINNKEYTLGNKNFFNDIYINSFKHILISNKNEQNKIKTLCNTNGDIIGYYNYSKKKSSITHVQCTNNSSLSNVNIISYKCNPFLNETVADQHCIEANIDCINITFNITSMNRQKLYSYFINNGYNCKYNPQTYSGIKFIYKVPFKEVKQRSGICSCHNRCICSNITFLIFQSGSVIVSGFKDMNQIQPVLTEFIKITNEFYYDM